MDSDATLTEKCRSTLAECWRRVTELAEQGELSVFLSDHELAEAIEGSINSRTKTYRYVLPTQLVAKLASEQLDCRCIQMTRGGAGAFDARTIAHKVIVPFDRDNESVLGGFPEPYVNNPLRIPEVSAAYREPQRDKAGWDQLCLVLERVQRESDPAFTESVFLQTLKEIHGRLGLVQVTYPAPRRVSLEHSIELIETFTEERSGGDRFEAVTAALFQTLGPFWGMFSTVRRAKVTTADTSAGMLGDIECVDDAKNVVLLVEAKDRALTITQVQKKIPGLRAK